MRRFGNAASIVGLGFILPCLLTAPVHAQKTEQPQLLWESVVKGKESFLIGMPAAAASAGEKELAVADIEGPKLIIFKETADDGWAGERTIPLPGVPVSMTVVNDHYVVSLRGGRDLTAIKRGSWRIDTIKLPGGTVTGALATTPEGDLLIYDVPTGAVLRYDWSGKSVATPYPKVPHVKALAAGAGGRIFAVCPHKSLLKSYDPERGAWKDWRLKSKGPVPVWPAGIATDDRGDLWVVDRHNGNVMRYNAAGRLEGLGARKGHLPGLLFYPSGITMMPTDRVAVVDQGNGRVQVYRRTAKWGSQ